MTLTLYTFKLSLWAGAPRLAINELDIPNVNHVEVDLSRAENFSPSYLKINPNHTVPALDIGEKILGNTRSVVEYLNSLAENKLSLSSKQAEIDTFLNLLHGEGDVGNPLFFTASSQQELDVKKHMVVPFFESRIRGWEEYIKQAPEHTDLYNQHIQTTRGTLDMYTGSDAQPMFDMNQKLWVAAKQTLDVVEELLLTNGDYIFGQYSIADIHFTPYLYRLSLVRKPEQIFENRPSLEAYYNRVKARPSFLKTFN